MRHYTITIISAAGRAVRHIIAHSSMRATQIAIGMFPEQPGEFAVICKSEQLA